MKKNYIIVIDLENLASPDYWAERFTDWLTHRLKSFDSELRFSIMHLDNVENRQFYALYFERDEIVSPEYWAKIFKGWLEQRLTGLDPNIRFSVYDVHDLRSENETESSFTRHPSNWRGDL